MTIKTSLLLFVISTCSFAQLGAGFKGGVPLTDLYEGQGSNDAETKRYIVGAMVELRLPAGFSIEGDALFSKANLSAFNPLNSTLLDADAWEFPVVLKKKLFGANAIAASVQPYVEAGASFRRISGLSSLPAFVFGNGGQVDKNNTGFVIGGGVEIRALFLRVAPEFRFTHWGSDTFTGGLLNVWKTNRNQGQFLVGIYF